MHLSDLLKPWTLVLEKEDGFLIQYLSIAFVWKIFLDLAATSAIRILLQMYFRLMASRVARWNAVWHSQFVLPIFSV